MPGKPGYNELPTEEDRIHCLAFVLNANTVSLMDGDLVKKIKAIRSEAKGRSMDLSCVHIFITVNADLNPIAILTNVDRICPLTEDETKNIFHSKEVDNKVGKSGHTTK